MFPRLCMNPGGCQIEEPNGKFKSRVRRIQIDRDMKPFYMRVIHRL